MIDVLDYGVGNIRSVLNAFNDVSDSVKFCKSVNEVRDSSRIVFPGVGAFQPAMKKLIDGSWTSLIRNFREENRPVLGICLGFQLMHKISGENGIHEGLGIFQGRVLGFKDIQIPVSIPNIGWRRISITNKSPIFKNFSEKDAFYFLHSYYCELDTKATVATSGHGIEFSAVNIDGMFIGAQFHPEKSSDSGKKFISNFINWNPN